MVERSDQCRNSQSILQETLLGKVGRQWGDYPSSDPGDRQCDHKKQWQAHLMWMDNQTHLSVSDRCHSTKKDEEVLAGLCTSLSLSDVSSGYYHVQTAL